MSDYKIDEDVLNIYKKAVLDNNTNLQEYCILQIEEAMNKKIDETRSSVGFNLSILFIITGIILRLGGVL